MLITITIMIMIMIMMIMIIIIMIMVMVSIMIMIMIMIMIIMIMIMIMIMTMIMIMIIIAPLKATRAQNLHAASRVGRPESKAGFRACLIQAGTKLTLDLISGPHWCFNSQASCLNPDLAFIWPASRSSAPVTESFVLRISTASNLRYRRRQTGSSCFTRSKSSKARPR